MAGIYNFTIKKGAEFTRTIVWNDSDGNPVDLTGKTARLEAKKRYTDTTSVIDITSDDNISLGDNGDIVISWTAAETGAMDFRYLRHDLYIDDTHLLSGHITLERSSIDG